MTTTIGLGALVEGDGAILRGEPDLPITGIAYDSRRVRPGNAFVAIPGFVHDGLEFVPDALARGAAAIVSEAPAPTIDESAWVLVDSARAALASLACRWYGDPSHELVVVGVTGTNGKTTVTALLERLLSAAGPVGRWSTTGVRIGDESFPTPRTTPEALELQEALARMRDVGCRAAAIEVSSHALALQRVAGTAFDAAVFTNLSPDHLDFHRDMNRYLDAKAILFESLAPQRPAVINLSDPAGSRLARRTSGRAVTYGWDAGTADHVLSSYRSGPDGIRLTLEGPAGGLRLESPMLGRANAENVAAAAVTALELGVSGPDVASTVAGFAGEPGRLEAVDRGQDFTVLVDFAHTPAALAAALEAAAGIAASGRVIVVFGCGGDRDRGKRPTMGRIAAAAAELAIVTSDNPRSEDPDAIIRQVLEGMADEDGEIFVQADRTLAIEAAIEAARSGDCVLIAGKGHETEQIFADRTIPFDDRQVAARCLRQRTASRSR